MTAGTASRVSISQGFAVGEPFGPTAGQPCASASARARRQHRAWSTGAVQHRQHPAGSRDAVVRRWSGSRQRSPIGRIGTGRTARAHHSRFSRAQVSISIHYARRHRAATRDSGAEDRAHAAIRPRSAATGPAALRAALVTTHPVRHRIGRTRNVRGLTFDARGALWIDQRARCRDVSAFSSAHAAIRTGTATATAAALRAARGAAARAIVELGAPLTRRCAMPSAR